MQRITQLREFYDIIGELEKNNGGRCKLSGVSYSLLPKRGVYFFFEPGEMRTDSGTTPRVVRVGTHALAAGSSSTLGGRLRQHRGAIAGGGNHRGSIFRLLVGQALIERGSTGACASWGIASDRTKASIKLGTTSALLAVDELPVEQAVGLHIGTMDVLWLSVDDQPGPESLRHHVEAGAIALLSNFERDPLDLPSPGWLGHASDRKLVRGSGLWNQRHVKEHPPSDFLEVFAAAVRSSAQ